MTHGFGLLRKNKENVCQKITEVKSIDSVRTAQRGFSSWRSQKAKHRHRRVQNPTGENTLEAGWHWPGMVRSVQVQLSLSPVLRGLGGDGNWATLRSCLWELRGWALSHRTGVCQVRTDSSGPHRLCVRLAKYILSIFHASQYTIALRVKTVYILLCRTSVSSGRCLIKPESVATAHCLLHRSTSS